MDTEAERPTDAFRSVVCDRSSPQRSYEIAGLAGPGVGLHRPFEADDLRVGKARSNHLSQPDPVVSRFHCVMQQTPRGLRLRDLGSSNGTQAVCQWERDYLPRLMREAGGNLSLAARLARIDRGHLRDLLRQQHLAAG